MEPPKASDAAVRATNDEAFVAKISAVTRRYFKDPYLLALQASTLPSLTQADMSRQPMINRGTFARVSFVRGRVSKLVNASPEDVCPQVVSFGAGYDSLPFCLLGEGSTQRRLRYLELDFGDIVSAKAEAVASSPTLAATFEHMQRANDGGLVANTTYGGSYSLCSCDLRNADVVRRVMVDAGLDFSSPTVFVAECVLVYMDPMASDALIRLAHSEFTGPRGFVNYEPIEPNDKFGEQMVANIALRGSPLLGIQKYPSVEAQRSRFANCGWSRVDAMTMLDAFSVLFSPSEIRRINRLEMLDEIEEFQLMMSHYCFVWACDAPQENQEFLERIRL